MHFIFRKSDGVVLYEAHTLEQYSHEKAACLANEGGTEADYLYLAAPTPTPPGMLATVSRDGEVQFIEHPTVTANNSAKTIVAGKLRSLGLDDADLRALGIKAP
jgi:hypothetical protein